MSNRKTKAQKRKEAAIVGNTVLPAVFVKGQEYKLRYSKTYPSRRWRGTNIPSEYTKRVYCGMYEYLGNRGSKLHFYDNNAGVDVLLSKSDALSALQNGT